MEKKDVVIFLKTPLYRFKYVIENEEQQLIENAVHVEGRIIKEKQMGIVVHVKEVSNQKERQTELPFESIFLPFEKIDFMIVL